MTYGPYDAMMDLGTMSALLLIAQFLRSKINILQDLYLPASVIAGVLGIVFGSNYINVLPFSGSIGSYSYLLSCFVFGALFIGYKDKISAKKILNEAGDTFALNCGMEVGQYGFAILAGVFIIPVLFPDVPVAFGVLMPSGFSGGFAFASSIGGMVTEMTGWEDATAIANTFATIGLLLGVFGGILLINIYCRRGATRFVKDVKDFPRELKAGFLEENSRPTVGDQTTSPMSMETLAFHLSLIGVTVSVGYLIYLQVAEVIEISFISIALLVGIALNFVLKIIQFQKYVDKRIITRISSCITDYLVAFGIASIDPAIVVSYAAPLLFFIFFGILHAAAMFALNRKLYHNFWFERTIYTFGWSLGLVTTGMTLLRIVDPEYKSRTLEDYGMASLIISPFEIAIVAFVPMFVCMGFALETGLVCVAVWAALTLFAIKKYGINRQKDSELRVGEEEILNQVAAEKAARAAANNQ